MLAICQNKFCRVQSAQIMDFFFKLRTAIKLSFYDFRGGSMSFFKDFDKFVKQRKVIDFATTFMIGAAFSKIVSSLIDGIIMPVIGVFLGGINIAEKKITIGSAIIKWGEFLQNLLDFFIIALVVFWI